MEKLVLTFVGGCHVAGYLVGQSHSFVDHLNTFFAPQAVHRIPYTKIAKLDSVLEPARKIESKYVFIQLGNFEFSASWKQILTTTTGLPGWVSNLRLPSKSGADVEVQLPTGIGTPAPAHPGANCISGLSYARRSIQELSKAGIGGSLYLLTWLVMRKHRRQFQLLNHLIEQNPGSTFVCMSPFPCQSRTHNRLRKLGGWIMGQRLLAQPNLRWVNTHDVLKSEQNLFVDGVHLNEQGHRTLAHHLQAVCLQAA